MMSWEKIVEIGHSAVMLPMAGAIGAWLIAGRAWSSALCWCVLFAAGLSIVALSKIAFLGWGEGIPALDFKALSGHAFRSTAVVPALFFVVLQGKSASLRTGGVAVGIAFSVALGVLLVHFKFHTASEVIASSVLGGSVSLGFMRIATTLSAPRVRGTSVLVSIIVLIVIWGLKPSSFNDLLIDVVLYLSGRDRPYGGPKFGD